MTRPLAPTDFSDDPQSLALVAEGKCPCRGPKVPGPGMTEPCGLPIDPDSPGFMCAGHDNGFQDLWPDRYKAMTGRPANPVAAESTPAELAAVNAYLASRREGQ